MAEKAFPIYRKGDKSPIPYGIKEVRLGGCPRSGGKAGCRRHPCPPAMDTCRISDFVVNF